MVQDDELSAEIGSTLGWLELGFTGNITTAQLLDGNVLDVEANIVSGNGLGQGFVMHLHGLDFSGDVSGCENYSAAAPVSTRPTGTVPIPPIL